MIVTKTAKSREQRMFGRLKVDLAVILVKCVILSANRLYLVTSQMLIALVYKAQNGGWLFVDRQSGNGKVDDSTA